MRWQRLTGSKRWYKFNCGFLQRSHVKSVWADELTVGLEVLLRVGGEQMRD